MVIKDPDKLPKDYVEWHLKFDHDVQDAAHSMKRDRWVIIANHFTMLGVALPNRAVHEDGDLTPTQQIKYNRIILHTIKRNEALVPIRRVILKDVRQSTGEYGKIINTSYGRSLLDHYLKAFPTKGMYVGNL